MRGREQQALQVFQESMEYYGRLQQEGQIDGFEPFLLGPHGGDLNGFIILRGERAKLAEIRFSDEFERLLSRAVTIIDSAGVIPAYGGEALGRQMELFQTAAADLGG